MAYQESVNLTQLTETYLDENNKQNVMKYATAAARTADAALAAVLREGMFSYLDDLNVYQVYSGAAWSTIGPAHGAWTAYTPAVVQGASVTSTNSGSAYMRIGRTIIGRFQASATSAGTAANIVTVSLPVAASTSDANTRVGLGDLIDVSVPNFFTSFVLTLASSTTVAYQIYQATGGAGRANLGTSNFTVALASGDVLEGNFTYEAAADA